MTDPQCSCGALLLPALGIAPRAVGLVLLLSTFGHISQVSLPPMRDSAASWCQNPHLCKKKKHHFQQPGTYLPISFSNDGCSPLHPLHLSLPLRSAKHLRYISRPQRPATADTTTPCFLPGTCSRWLNPIKKGAAPGSRCLSATRP